MKVRKNYILIIGIAASYLLSLTIAFLVQAEIYNADTGVYTYSTPAVFEGDVRIGQAGDDFTLCLNSDPGTTGSCVSNWSDIPGINYWSKTNNDIFYTDGNVGIGTTGGITGPDETLHVLGSIVMEQATANLGDFGASIGWKKDAGADTDPNADATYRARIRAVRTDTDDDAIGLAFFTHPSFTNTDPDEEVLRITHTGNVGIGTTKPGGKLDIYGGDLALRGPSGQTPSIVLGENVTDSYQLDPTPLGTPPSVANNCDGNNDAEFVCPVNSTDSCTDIFSGTTDVGTVYYTQEVTCVQDTSTYRITNEYGSIKFINNAGNPNFVIGQDSHVAIGKPAPDAGIMLDVAGSVQLTGLCIAGESCKTSWQEIISDTLYTAGDGLSLTGTTFSVAAGTGLTLTQEASGLALKTTAIAACTGTDQKIIWDAVNSRLICGTDIDTDTNLTEAEVEQYITNGAINLAADTTLGGAVISTGAHTDTLADLGLACFGGQVAKWVVDTTTGVGSWVCANDEGTGVTTDHGSLEGLVDDDHQQYVLVTGSRAMTGNLTVSNLHLNTDATIFGTGNLILRGEPGNNAPIYIEGNPVVINNDPNTGNVGIGTENPSATLEVFGNLKVASPIGGTNSLILGSGASDNYSGFPEEPYAIAVAPVPEEDTCNQDITDEYTCITGDIGVAGDARSCFDIAVGTIQPPGEPVQDAWFAQDVECVDPDEPLYRLSNEGGTLKFIENEGNAMFTLDQNLDALTVNGSLTICDTAGANCFGVTGAGPTPDLQAVTNAGADTTHAITVAGLKVAGGTLNQAIISTDSIDGSDDNALIITSAGSSEVDRGASIGLFGNENPYLGSILFTAGDTGSETIVFQTGGATRMQIDSDGYVGIGLTNPQSKLHLKGGQPWGTDLSLEAEEAGGRRWVLISTNDLASEGGGRFLIKDQSVDNNAGKVRMTISEAGDVGIGVSPISITTDSDLDVQGNIRNWGSISSAGDITAMGQINANGGIKLPTDAVAGAVLTSDTDGVGTWQNLPEGIPTGLIAMFNSNCPDGWSNHTALNASRFPRGTSGTTGGTGGDDDHQHSLSGTTGAALSGGTTAEGQALHGVVSDTEHVHLVGTLSADQQDNVPEFVSVRFCVKN